MQSESFGKITKISGSKITILVQYSDAVNKVSVNNFVLNYVSIGSLVGTRLVDGRTLVLTVEEIYEHAMEHYISASISGIYDNVLKKSSFGTNAYPLIGERIFTLSNSVLCNIFAPNKEHEKATIGTYIYDDAVPVGYNPDVLFGKHLGVYGNTGSGKTCIIGTRKKCHIFHKNRLFRVLRA
jgi:DNA helicase HerA-like ATPase